MSTTATYLNKPPKRYNLLAIDPLEGPKHREARKAYRKVNLDKLAMPDEAPNKRLKPTVCFVSDEAKPKVLNADLLDYLALLLTPFAIVAAGVILGDIIVSLLS